MTGLITCHHCDESMGTTKINLDVIFTAKKQSDEDRVFCCAECVIEYVQQMLDDVNPT